MAAPLPPNEKRRLEVLWQYELLDTVPEEAFDELTALAASICAAPIALISLVDEKRQWFKSKIGLSVNETRRDISFCAHAILGDDLMIVPDALQDERFAHSPMVVGEPHIRFYAGAPLVTPDGHALGTLCVIDKVPRDLTPEQRNALRVLSHHVMMQLELRRRSRELHRASAERARIRNDLHKARAELARVRKELAMQRIQLQKARQQALKKGR
jgi:GAF domain-containing protein